MRPVAEIVELYRGQGLRITPQRLTVFRVLADYDGHPTVEDVWGLVRAELPTIALRTVYEALHELDMLGEIRLISAGTGSRRVELKATDDHSHLVCSRCGAVRDIDVRPPDVTSASDPKLGFVTERADVVFSGLCEHCARARHARRPEQ